MSQPDHITAINLSPLANAELDADNQAYFAKCEEKIGFIPNVLRAYSFDNKKLRNFIAFCDEIMLGESGLSKLEREMIAVVVSAANRCYYCLIAHGAAVRKLSKDPVLGELLVTNYRVADLPQRQRAMLDFAEQMTNASHQIDAADRQRLRDAGLSERDIWDVVAVAGFFNMSNRMASALDMMPNLEYHSLGR